MSTVRVSIVIPAYNETDSILPTLDRISEAVQIPYEIIIVVDSADDLTIPVLQQNSANYPNTRVLVQDLGRGPANAIRFGFSCALAEVVIVTMADGSDDAQAIEPLVRLVERGCVIAAASRYMPGGQQIGGPRLKKFVSHTAGVTLHFFAGVGTRDATNSFKAYSREFVEAVGIDSRQGFEIGIEMVAKARRRRLPVAEIPTVWLDREVGISNFQFRRWLPKYLTWYFHAYGRAIDGPHVGLESQKGERSE
jgi:dolichol-phosphate mannosyltransferase